MTDNKYFKKMLNIILIIFALTLVAFSINFFFAPAKIAAGGATGLSIILNELFGFDRSLVVLIINIFMIILSIVFLDKKTVIKISFGSFVLPIILEILPSNELIHNKLLAIIIGSAIFATGVAILYRIDSSSGGTAVPPLILKKYFNINTATSLLIIDVFVSLGNFITGGFEAFAIAVFSLVITALVMDYIETGLNRKKAIYIISNNYIDDINSYLDENNIATTIFDVRGGFSDKNKNMLMVILDNHDYNKALIDLRKLAPDIFIMIYDMKETHGGTFL